MPQLRFPPHGVARKAVPVLHWGYPKPPRVPCYRAGVVWRGAPPIDRSSGR